MKIRPVGADLFHADGRMVGQTKGRRGRHDEPKSSLITILRTRLKMYYSYIFYIILTYIGRKMLDSKF